jgi:sugar lactone lactonase YvrE
VSKTVRLSLMIVAAILALVATLLFRTLELGRMRASPAPLENLNPAGEYTGPEGLQFDRDGNMFVSDSEGRLWKTEKGGRPAIYLDLRHAQLPDASSLHLGGIAFDAAGNLNVAAYGYAGGALIRVDPATRTARVFASGIGVANFVAATSDGSRLWVSDYRGKGRVLRFAADARPPATPELTVEGLASPNGLAPGRDDRYLFVAETYAGDIARIDLSGKSPKVDRIANLKGTFAVGSLDGLGFDPRDKDRRFLYVAENLRGLITVVDVDSTPALVMKRIRLAQMGGRPCPASVAILDGDLYFTDLWSASPLRILAGFPKLRRSAYRFRVTDLSAIH